MKMNIWVLIAVIVLGSSCVKEEKYDYDIIIYGATASGVVAARSAALVGKNVLLIEPGNHLGGMTTGGLGATDIGNKFAVTGISRDFYRRLGKHYGKLESWHFEPHVAEKIMNDFISDLPIKVLLNSRLSSVEKDKETISSVLIETGENFDTKEKYSAKMFIDCTYEGDLMAKAGVSYFSGRESNTDYNETLNGVQFDDGNQIPDGIDPYIIEGDSTSGLLWGITATTVAPIGTGDTLQQAYNYRLCMTTDKDNMVKVERPADYDSTKYEILYRIIKQRDEAGWEQNIDQLYLRVIDMPNHKTDINNKGGFSTDFIGGNYDYPSATYERRKEIEEEHKSYIKGLIYFLGHDNRIPQHIKDQMLRYGWAKDEFIDTDHFPFQLYVREARRMNGEYIMTEHDCYNKTKFNDAVGMGAYNMDSHNCQRVIITKDGKKMVKNEGDIQHALPNGPYPISYRSITPKREECTNLLVPVCVSSTHIAFGSIRMEPVFMVLGQSAGLAASMAIDENISVQELDVQKLQKTLKENPKLDGSKPDINIDTEDGTAEIKGDWDSSYTMMNSNKKYSLVSIDNNSEQEISFNIPKKDGNYNIYFYSPNTPKHIGEWEWSERTPIIINSGNKVDTIYINQKGNQKEWVELGNFNLAESVSLKVKSAEKGIVAVDCILLVAE